jgi:hypothetical protein
MQKPQGVLCCRYHENTTQTDSLTAAMKHNTRKAGLR